MNKQTLTYLQQDQIGKVIAKGLASVYTEKPNAPVKYLAHWLQTYSNNQRQLKNIEAHAKKTQTNLKIFQSNLALQQQQKKQKAIEKQKQQQKVKKFKDEIASHQYQQQLLDDQVCQFIEQQFNFTGVYIGELNHPKRNVTEQDTDQNAHLELSAPKLINYIGSSKSHKELILGKTLAVDKGVTGKAFELSLEDPPEQIGEDGNPIPQEKKQKCVYIPNVVKNQNMHYFRLPKLGAYVAIPLAYNSYLKQLIFDNALAAKKKENHDRQQFEKAKSQALAQLEKQHQDIQHRLNDLKQKAAQQSQIQTVQEQLTKWQERKSQKEVQKFEPQAVTLPTEKKEYVLCADNLGSDKEISPKARQFMIDFVLHFKNSWQKKEYQLLYKDVQTQITYERKYLDTSIQEILQGIEAQLELDEQTQQKMTAIEDQTLRNYKIEGWKIDKLKKYIKTNEKFIKSFQILKDFRVVKYKELIQNILYFQGKRKSEINHKNKAAIDWKNVRKNLINKDLFNNVISYIIQEPKSGEYPPYTKINSIIQKLESFPQADVFHYNIGLGILKKYIERALKHRINNIQLRKVQRENQRQKREQIILQNQKITQQKIRALQNHKATLPAQEVEAFSEEQWSTNYDQQHPLLEVPPEVVEDIDNDI